MKTTIVTEFLTPYPWEYEVEEDEESDQSEYNVAHDLPVALATAYHVRESIHAARQQALTRVKILVLKIKYNYSNFTWFKNILFVRFSSIYNINQLCMTSKEEHWATYPIVSSSFSQLCIMYNK